MIKYIDLLLKSTPSLIGLSILFVIFESYTTPIYSNYFGIFDTQKLPTLIFFIFYTSICFFILPLFLNKLTFKENLKDIGLTLPQHKIKAIFLILVSLLLLVPWMVYFASKAQFQGYSLGSPGPLKFFFIVGVLFPIYYFVEEFFFRGFLFISLWKRVGWHSYWITDIIFTLAHLGKPPLEVLLCIPVSIILSFITLSTKSIYPAMIVHSILGILLTCLVTFHWF